MQESFIITYEKLSSYRKESEFKTWFGRIVINQSLKKVRVVKRQDLNIEDVLENIIEDIENNLSNLDLLEKKSIISDVFESLSPNESLVLDLFYLKENSVIEIQELTGWSKSKVKMLLLRGRKSFYKTLSEVFKYKMEELL